MRLDLGRLDRGRPGAPERAPGVEPRKVIVDANERRRTIREILAEQRIQSPAIEKVIDILAANESLIDRESIDEKLSMVRMYAGEGHVVTLGRRGNTTTLEQVAALSAEQLVELEERELHGEAYELFGAIEDGLNSQVKRLLKRKRNPVDLEATSPRNEGMTPLILACWMRSPQLVELLLGAGARVDNHGRHRCGPIHYGAWGLKTLGLLLDAGADPNEPDDDGSTPLFYAAERDRGLEMVRLLLARGADRRRRNNKGRTALDVAGEKGAVRVTALLREE